MTDELKNVKPRKPSCGNCMLWQPGHDGYSTGECRHSAPTPDKYHRAKFPTIQDNKWCAAHTMHIFEIDEHVLHDNGKLGVVTGVEVTNDEITVKFKYTCSSQKLPIVYRVQLDGMPHVTNTHVTNMIKCRRD